MMFNWIKSLFKKKTVETKNPIVPKYKTVKVITKVPIYSIRIVIQESNQTQHEVRLKLGISTYTTVYNSLDGKEAAFDYKESKYLIPEELKLYQRLSLEKFVDLSAYRLTEIQHFYSFKPEGCELILPREAIKSIRIFDRVLDGYEECEDTKVVPV